VVDDVDAGQEPEPEVLMATAVQPPAPANSARNNKDDSDARIKQIQVNQTRVPFKRLMTLTVSIPLMWLCGPGSSVGIATGYGLDGPGIESRW
jgi:hypothetical protein